MIDENFIEFCCLDKLVERRDAIQVQPQNATKCHNVNSVKIFQTRSLGVGVEQILEFWQNLPVFPFSTGNKHCSCFWPRTHVAGWQKYHQRWGSTQKLQVLEEYLIFQRVSIHWVLRVLEILPPVHIQMKPFNIDTAIKAITISFKYVTSPSPSSLTPSPSPSSLTPKGLFWVFGNLPNQRSCE